MIFLPATSVYAQSVVIDSIVITGLNRTNKEIVLRDINIKPGDTLVEKK